MILVTVGSTHFDPLIEAIDVLAPKINKKIICQIGQGKYKPRNCEFFKYHDDFETLLKSSDLVITHGGITVLQCISYQKKIIAISNTALADDHQTTFLNVLSKHVDFPWSSKPSELTKLYENIEQYSFNVSESMRESLCDYVIDFSG